MVLPESRRSRPWTRRSPAPWTANVAARSNPGHNLTDRRSVPRADTWMPGLAGGRPTRLVVLW